MNMIDIPGGLWLKEVDDSVPNHVEDFFDVNPQIRKFVEHVDHQITDALIVYFQSVLPNERGHYLSVIMQDKDDPEGKKRYLNIKDSKHCPFDEMEKLGSYARRELEITFDIGTSLYRSKKIGSLKKINRFPKKLMLDHKCEHVSLPCTIKNNIPPLEELVEEGPGILVGKSSEEIRGQLGKDVVSYLFENKESLGIKKLIY